MNGSSSECQGTVYVVDDDAELRQSLRCLIETVGLRVRTFGCADEFLRNLKPDVIGCLVLDVRMPGQSGIELQEQLNNDLIDLPVILLTGYADVPMAVQAMRAGAFDIVQKPFSHQALLDRISHAIAKHSASQRKRQVLDDIRRRFLLLSEGEREVLELLGIGKSSNEIAAALKLSRRAIEVRRKKVVCKMEADSLAELIRMTIQLEQN